MMSNNARGLVTSVAAVAALLLVATVAPAHADLSSKVVQKEMKGQLVITAQPLSPPEGDDKEVVKALKKASVKSLKNYGGEEAKGWSFAFIAFMKSAPGATELSLDFYRDKKTLAANKILNGVDPKLPLLEGQIDITEDDGIDVGKTYEVKLVAGKKVLATTKLTLK